MIATTSPPMSPRLVEFFRHRGRWFTAAVALALLPKCVLCLAAYAGLGTALGVGGVELCGAPSGPWAVWMWAWPLAGVAVAASGWLVRRCRR